MAKNVRKVALDQIASDRAEGYTLVLATASYRLYVEAIAARLGFDAVIATDHLGQDLDYVRARIAGENCYDVAKLRMIQDWMAGKGVIRANSHIRAYSDHVSDAPMRSEEHTSELQSLMRISYAVFCLKKKTELLTLIIKQQNHHNTTH